jgi:hypothetical protein
MTKFKIGDEVVSKKLGLPCVAIVYGVLDAKTLMSNLLVMNQANAKSQYDTWSKQYPDYIDKDVYYLKYKKPQRSMSLQEYIEQVTEAAIKHFGYMPEQSVFEEQYKKIPKMYLCCNPEDDLELFGEEND